MSATCQMAKYRKDHPEFYAKELKKRSEEIMHLYHNDEEYRAKVLAYSRNYYADPAKREKKLAYQKQRYAMKKHKILQITKNNLYKNVDLPVKN